MTFKYKLSCRLALLRDLLPLFASAALVACEVPVVSSDPAVSVVQVVVVPESLSLDAAQQQKFAAYGRAASGDTASVAVTWSATGGSITSDGMFAADTAAGDFQVSATNATLKLTGSSRVRIRPRPVASVAVTPASASVVIGATVQLAATARDANGRTLSGRLVTWGSNSAAVATVNANGLVTGVAAGAATITATSEGKSATSAVTVTLAPVASVTVSPTLASVPVGQTAQISATPHDANGNALTGRVVTWASSNTGVATVNGSGLVTAVAAGPAIITATSEGKNGTAGITVTLTPAAVASVSVSPASANVSAGQTVQLAATTRDASGNVLLGRVVTWASSNTGLATVNGSGLVTGVAAGAATITATSEGQSGSAAVTVTVPVASVSVSPATTSVMAGQTVQLTATPRDANGNALTGRVVTWASSNTAIATVNGSGLVTGVAAGAATITATSEGKNGTAAITVTPVPVATVSVSPAATSVTAGQTVQLTATPRDANGNVLTGRVVTWGSSNTGVATVSGSGLVTGVAAGSATITATSEGQSGSAGVTVTVGGPNPAECATPQAGWIWCDDFEQNRLSSYFEYDNGGGSFVRAATVGRNGSYGMRAHFDVGQVSAGALHLAFGKTPQAFFRPVDAGTAIYRDIYWRVYVKHQAGWVGGGGNKLTRAFSFASSTSWAQAMFAHVWSGGSPDENYLILDPASGTNAAGNLVTTTYNDFPNMTWLGLKRGATPLFDASHVGQWYCIEAHAQLNDAGLSNGVFEFWLDGTVEARETGLNWVGTFSAYGINAAYLENFWNTGSPAAQERYFDNFVVSTQRIGC